MGNRRIHPEEIMQRVAIFHLGQTTDHKRTGILRTEKLDLGYPVQELLPFFLRRLLACVCRRHVMSLHAGERLLPPFAGGCVAGVLERRQEINATLPFLLPVTLRAVGRHEGRDAITKGLLSIGLQRGEIPGFA